MRIKDDNNIEVGEQRIHKLEISMDNVRYCLVTDHWEDVPGFVETLDTAQGEVHQGNGTQYVVIKITK